MRWLERLQLGPSYPEVTARVAPFLDVGDHTPVEPGMVFTIEPGLYASDVGGFRHSDTVVVAETGSTSSPPTRRTSRA